MIDGYAIHGHAIVSADDRIADANGDMPAGLRNEADWLRFQTALDRAAVTVLGRRGHQANPNVRRRNRLVVTSVARGIERWAETWWWNPGAAPLSEALAKAAPEGGTVAVLGGWRVFDLFLDMGYDEFHLVRAEQVRLPDGVPTFGGILKGQTAEEILAAHGLVPGLTELLDPGAHVSLAVWRKP